MFVNMARPYCNYCTFILLTSIFSLSWCSVPVLIWESSAISQREDVVPALVQLDTDEFSNHIVKKVHVLKPLIAVFLEESLSVEDFSWQDDQHHGSFPQLQNITGMSAKIEFIPSVEDPISALKELELNQNYQWKKYDGSSLPNKPGIILEVKLKDPLNNEDRPDMLRRHDGNIAEIYSQLLAKHSHVVAIFTGKQSSWVEPEINRVRRGIEEDNSNSSYFINSGGIALLYSSKFPVLYDSNETYPLETTQSNDIPPDTREALIRVTTTNLVGNKKITLRYRFEKNAKSWQLRQVEYDKGSEKVMLKANTDISAPMDSSFKSSSPVEFTDGSVRLVFKNLQVQPWVKEAKFSKPDTTESTFFTIPIWSALFVTFILALIFTWAMTMLMDIRTMDRFDDPKGKTISVNVSE